MILNYLQDPFFQFGATSVLALNNFTNWFVKRPMVYNVHRLPFKMIFSGLFWYYLNQHRLRKQQERFHEQRALALANQVNLAFEAEGQILDGKEEQIKSYIKGINY